MLEEQLAKLSLCYMKEKIPNEHVDLAKEIGGQNVERVEWFLLDTYDIVQDT